jgi:hypothetical protein
MGFDNTNKGVLFKNRDRVQDTDPKGALQARADEVIE